MKCSGLILAAGSGARTGSTVPKQFMDVGGSSVLDRVRLTMESARVFSEVISVVPEYHTTDESYVIGGNTRIESMYNGVIACKEDYIIFTDAARLYTPYWVFQEIHKMLGDKPIVVLQKVYDSTVVAGEQPIWVNYSRALIRKLQSPNGFKKKVLLNLLEDLMERGFWSTSVIGEYIKQYGQPQYYTKEFFNEKVTTASEIEHAMQFFGKG
jgi:2-C-methyl-D-erythritol 4-phosphate cytidylyltransferase